MYKIRNCGKCSNPLLLLTTYPRLNYRKAVVELGLDETFMMNDLPSLAIDLYQELIKIELILDI